MKLPIRTDGDVQTALLDIENSVPVCDNADFCKGLFLMIAGDRGRLSEMQKWVLLEACERNNVMPKEMYNAFWKAVSDSYVPKTGIEFRHLWKYIEKERYGEDGRLFTYEKMLQYCDKNHCTTDVFEMIKEEKDSQGRPKWALK